MHYKWRYKQAPPPRRLPRPSRPMAVAAGAMLVGAAVWIAGFHWGIVLTVLGLAGVFIAGIWGVRPTSETNPNDGTQWAPASHNLLEVHPPSDLPTP